MLISWPECPLRILWFDSYYLCNNYVAKWKTFTKKTLTSQLSGPLIRSNGLCLCKISSMMSQFSTNKRTISVFCCYLFAVFNNCWSTTPSFSSNSYTKLWYKYQTITLNPAYPQVIKHFRCKCQWRHAQAKTQKHTLKNT